MRLLTRAQWGATVPTSSQLVRPPVRTVFLHHSVTPATSDVAADMRVIERVGRDRFGRFSYSFAGHPDGTVATGAGLTVGAHTAGHNSTALGYVLIGNYDNLDPTPQQIAAFGEWWRFGVQEGWIHPGAELVPHRDVKATACPGANTIRRWDEFLAARNGDSMSVDLTNFFFGGTPEAEWRSYNQGAKAILNTNHFAANIIPQVLANLQTALVEARQAALNAEAHASHLRAELAAFKTEVLQAIAAIPTSTGSGATAAEIVNEIRDRLAA